MAKAVSITRTDMENVLRAERGWTKNLDLSTKEDVYDWPLTGTTVTIRVYTSIQTATGLSRPVGGDAIRACAINTWSNGKVVGYIGTTRVHRVENWRVNLHSRIGEVIEAAQKRWDASEATFAKKTVAAETTTAIDPEKFAGLFGMFDNAGDKLKFPKLSLTVNGQPLRLSVAGEKSSRPGTMQITDGKPYGMNKWFGSIDPKTGRIHESKHWTPEVGKIIEVLAADPVSTVAAFGQKTGHCCMCSKKLTDPRSVKVGYGATCASNWNMPYPTMTEVS